MSNWDSELYLRFKKERGQPSLDLISRLTGDFKNILDLGSGPGNSTQNLCTRFPNAQILGVDADENMLEKARSEHPDLDFKKAFLPDGLDSLGRFDLIFSNACIHWISDQNALIQKVGEHLENGGVFAVQIPLTDESPFYKILYEIIAEKDFVSVSKIRNFYNFDEFGYYNALSKHFSSVQIWKTYYHHIVGSVSDIISWYKGSGLRPYLEALDENGQKNLIARLEEKITENYTRLCDGNYFLVMPRLFFVAKK